MRCRFLLVMLPLCRLKLGFGFGALRRFLKFSMYVRATIRWMEDFVPMRKRGMLRFGRRRLRNSVSWCEGEIHLTNAFLKFLIDLKLVLCVRWETPEHTPFLL